MGYIVHHAIAVTFCDEKIIEKTHKKAREIFKNTNHCVTRITPIAVNNESSYFIAPDGSKLGWDESKKCANARETFIKYLKSVKPYPPHWALIQYGDENGNDYMIDSDNIEYKGEYPE